MKRNLLILAAGLATRNAKFTLQGALPKVLQSLGHKTILESIIESYNTLHLDRIVIACRTEHFKAIREVLNIRLPKTRVNIVTYDNADGTTNSVLNVIRKFDAPGDWYIQWSDVIAKVPYVTTPTIFTDYSHKHRNLLIHHNNQFRILNTQEPLDRQIAKIEKPNSGNIAGLFYATENIIQRMLKFQDEKFVQDVDFDKAFLQCSNMLAYTTKEYINEMRLKTILDIGDVEKYETFANRISSDNVCRYFNEITIGENYVIKRPITEVGFKLHDLELEYYKRFSENTPFAKLLHYDESNKAMHLERIVGQSCQTFINQGETPEIREERAKSLLPKFYEAIDAMIAQTDKVYSADEIPNEEERHRAVLSEFVQAINKRVKPVIGMINHTIDKHNLKTFNGDKITEYYELLGKINTYIRKHINEFNFGLVHGDTNTDNTMIDLSAQIRFIDPRGYFGTFETLGYGVKEYDIAKFVYGISGYSFFNSAPFIPTEVDNGNLIAKVQDISILEEQPELIQVLVGIIWLKLSSYIINDPSKSVLAYLQGNAILTKILM